MKTLLSIGLILSSHLVLAQRNVIDSLERIVALHSRDTTEMNALLNLTNEFLRKDLEKAKTYAYQLMALARAKENNGILAYGYSYMVVLHQNSGRLDSATHYLGMLEALSKASPSNPKIRISHGQSAGLFYKNQGQYRKALPYMLDILNLLTVENENKAGQLLNIGNTYNNLSDNQNAVRYHLQSLSLFDKLKNKRGQSFCLQNLGNDFLNLRQFEKAKKYYEQSLQLKQVLQDKRGTITAYAGLGDVSKELGKFETAKQYYDDAIQLSREMKLLKEESRCQFQLGLLYARYRDMPRAKENILQSLTLAKQAGDSTLVAKMDSELKGLYQTEKKEKGTEEAFLANINTFIHSGDRGSESLGYARLSEYYASKNQFDKAFYYLKRHQQLKDSVEGTAVLLQMKHLEEQYKSEKKEREIELLKKEQALHDAEIKRKEAYQTGIGIALISVIVISFLLINRYRIMNRAKRLVEIENVRNNIARDLHDDMGSALSSINILSQVALVEKNGNTQHYLQRIGEQSSRMMEDMGDMVWSINPQNDSMGKVIIRMREFATEVLELKNIAYHFSESIPEGLALNADKRKNLFLIFKEAINNAAKYSQASEIDIRLRQHDHTLMMSIADNGQGFDENTIRTGNGLNNLRERAKEMNGMLTINSTVGQGTSIELSVPIA